MSRNTNQRLFSERSSDIEDVIEEFESQWRSGETPEIEDYLLEDGEKRLPMLAELVQSDLEFRLKSDSACRMEQYMERFPELASDTEMLVPLLVTEFRLRQRNESTLHVAEYEDRFPEIYVQFAKAVAGSASLGTHPKDSDQQRWSEPRAASPAGEDSVESTLGRFRIVRRLGKGAFGSVFAAHDPKLDRQVALKVPRAGVLVDREDIERFMREGRAAAQLEHPHIVPVFESGESDGHLFIASGLVVGETLREVLKRGHKYTVKEAAALVCKLASALHYAHTKGIIHRDIKPENILLDNDGEPHIADFGLARQVGDGGLRTRDGALMGTPAYMSPEQASGKAHLADARSDLWSLGVILYELVAGRRPFEGDVSELLIAVSSQNAKSLRVLDRSAPKDIDAICMKCLEKNPDQRYASCQHLADDLERHLGSQATLARPLGILEKTRRWCVRNSVLTTTSAIAVVLIMIVILVTQERQQRRRATDLTDYYLTNADPSQLHNLINVDMEPVRNRVVQLLRKKSGRSAREQWLISMALLPVESQQASILRESLLNADHDMVLPISTILNRYDPSSAAFFWEKTQQINEPDPQRRFRAACALATLDPDFDRWSSIAREVTGTLLAEDPFKANEFWKPAFRPVADIVFPHLREQSVLNTDETQKLLAMSLAADFSGGRRDKLVYLLREADYAQLRNLLPYFPPNDEAIVELLEQQAEQPFVSGLPDLSQWDEPSAQLREEFTSANGVLAERFAVYPGLTPARFEDLCSELNRFGYRPVCCRPSRVADQPSLTAIWARDGQLWQLIVDATTNDVLDRHNIVSTQQALGPVDLAGYQTSQEEIRYVCIWGPTIEDPGKYDFHFRVRRDELDTKRMAVIVGPRTTEGETRVGLMERWAQIAESELTFCGFSRSPIDFVAGAWFFEKLSNVAKSRLHEWRDLFDYEGESWALYRRKYDMDAILDTDTAIEELEDLGSRRCGDGFSPHSILPSGQDGGRTVSIVWNRPARTQNQNDQFARARTNAALVLAMLGRPERVLRSLESSEDERERTYAVHGLHLVMTPDQLWRHFDAMQSPSSRQAVLLALGEYQSLEQAIPKSRRSQLEKIYHADADPGLHSAAEWLLRQLDSQMEVVAESFPASLPVAKERGNRRWFVNSIGQTMIVLPPGTYYRGSPALDPYYDPSVEKLTRKRVPHTFAMASTEVTRTQFNEFKKAMGETHRPDPLWSVKDNAPPGRVSWVDACRFCNWLSEEEGLDPCYPPTLQADTPFDENLELKSGYRLPSDAEWEYACRAGTTTPRFYGFDESLLSEYAWWAQNADYQSHEVGQLKPNSWGLFDLYGNANEWCFDTDDTGDPLILNSSNRVLRGGTSGWGPRNTRSPFLNTAPPLAIAEETTSSSWGFRVVRTMPEQVDQDQDK